VPAPAVEAAAAATQSTAVKASCSISVVFKGQPRGQNLVNLTNYSPTSNSLGPYSTIGRRGLAPGRQGWFFAVQIQGDLVGDPDPANWTPSQIQSSSGSFTLRSPNGTEETITGSSGPVHDNPEIGVNQGTRGRLDWLDQPGIPLYQGGGQILTGANITKSFVSTLTHRSGVQCSISWSVTLTLSNGVATWSSGQRFR
jgi:hypothetical protein